MDRFRNYFKYSRADNATMKLMNMTPKEYDEYQKKVKASLRRNIEEEKQREKQREIQEKQREIQKDLEDLKALEEDQEEQKRRHMDELEEEDEFNRLSSHKLPDDDNWGVDPTSTSSKGGKHRFMHRRLVRKRKTNKRRNKTNKRRNKTNKK